MSSPPASKRAAAIRTYSNSSDTDEFLLASKGRRHHYDAGYRNLTAAPAAHRTRPTSTRWTSWVLFLIGFSGVAILGAIGFLTWLWLRKLDDLTWRRVILSTFSIQLITLASLAIRTAVGVLATIATSMIAAIAVESRGVPLEHVAEFSIARFSNNGPSVFFTSIFASSTLEIRLRLLAVVLLLATIASQFTSTLLLSDLRPGDVVTETASFANAYDVADRPELNRILPLFASSGSLWEVPPSSSEAFAEYHVVPATPQDHVDDTGPTIRAFLPFSAQRDREGLNNLTGTARVIDARVVCVRPKIGSLYYCPNGGICANVTQEEASLDGVLWEPAEQVWELYSVGSDDLNYRWALASMSGALATDLSNITSVADQQNFRSGSVLLSNSLTLPRQVASSGNTTGTAVRMLNSTEDGAWLHQWHRFQSPNDSSTVDFELRASLCFHSFGQGPVQFLNITASSDERRVEPEYAWNVSTNTYGSTEVRKQLGAVKGGATLSKANRQIMDLLASDIALELQKIAGKPIDPAYQASINVLDTTLTGRAGNQLVLCPVCGSGRTPAGGLVTQVSEVMSRMFSDAVDETQSPAMAIQAALTAQLRMEYYSVASTFVPGGTATATRFDVVEFPHSWRGYTSAVSIVVVQVVAFLLITWRFHRETRFSYPGNVWHTVAQVSESSELRGILRSSGAGLDRDVGAALSQGVDEKVRRRYVLSNGVFEPLR